MIDQQLIDNLNDQIKSATKVLIIQADNPDGDSLGSALALEQIVHEMQKEPFLYCGVDVPSYLRYLEGWDRVEKDLPKDFDLSIIVDCSSMSLLETLRKNNQIKFLSSKPCIVLDHHQTESNINFASLLIDNTSVATGQIIYEIANKLKWPLNLSAKERIATSILSDSLGLMSEGTTARTVHIIAELVEGGVNMAQLENIRREMMRKSPELLKYKGELLERVEFHDNNRIAIVTIPWEEIEKYSQSYNPSMLVLDDMRLVEGTDIAIAFKIYNDGKITAKIRTNFGIHIASNLAEHFGGGGHKYASGFRIEASQHKNFDELKNESIKVAIELLDKLKEQNDIETI